jgi:hypothetical protein
MIRAMDKPVSWRLLALPVVVALIVWWLAVAIADHKHGYYSVPDVSVADASDLSRFVLGAAVILTIAYGARIWAVRIDLVALIIWTVLFALAATGPTPFTTSQYVPVNQLIPRMITWFLVSAGILTAGYLWRRRESARSLP